MSTTLSAHEAARGELGSFGERLVGPDDEGTTRPAPSSTR